MTPIQLYGRGHIEKIGLLQGMQIITVLHDSDFFVVEFKPTKIDPNRLMICLSLR